jgi:chaperonin GroEL (HSP60 family)
MDTRQLFGEGARRTNGSDARRYNLLAARLIAEIVSNCLGPRGLDKMLMDILGELTITKDGATILRKIDVDHPAAKILIEASNAVDNEVGDGTTSVVILAGALTEKAEKLLDMGISPATIVEGYANSLEIALEALQDFSQSCDNTDRNTMLKLVVTCLQSKILSYSGDYIAKLIVDAVDAIADFSSNTIEPDDIKIEEKPGNILDTQFVKGIVIDKTIDSTEMPKMINNAKIMLIDDELEGKRTKVEAEIQVSSPDHIRSFKNQENLMIRSKIQHIIDSGANVIISRKGINTLAQHMLTQAGIISVRRVKENDLLWLAKATGASISEKLSHSGDNQGHGDSHTHNPHYDDNSHHHHHHHHHHHNDNHKHENAHDPRDKDLHYYHGGIDIKLGYAERVYEKFLGDDKMVFIEGCKNPKSVTLLLRANSKEALAECHRSVLDAINVLKDFITKPSIVSGGGCTEMAIAKRVKEKASQIAVREQIVIQKFAEALEEIPLTIARNAGMNVIDTLAELRLKNYQSNDNASSIYGVDAIERRIKVMFPYVIEPSVVKEQIIKTAVEVTNMLIRVDDVLMAKPSIYTHTHADGTKHSHADGEKKHEHDYFDRLGKLQRPAHHYY